MVFKRHDWREYGNRGNKIEIKIFDETDRKLDSFNCNNNKDFKIVARIIKQKYGFNFESNSLSKKKINEEMDFLKKDLGWD